MNHSRLVRDSLAAATAASMVALAAHAGEVSPGVRAAIAASPPGQPVPVIVTLADRVDPAAYQVSDRQERDGRLVRALREKAAATQGPLKGFLASRAPGRIAELWAINGVSVVVPPALIDELAAFPGVDVVRLDALVTAPAASTASTGPSEWNLDAVRAPTVWSRGYSGDGIVVANMDTGVDALHPDLAPRWRGGANSWYDPNGQHATPYDAAGHGTQTMALIVGGDAGGTSIGVAPGAQWIAAKLYDDAGYSTYGKIHLAFQWLLDPDGSAATRDEPDVVNASWGLLGTAGTCILEFETDIGILRSAGIGVVFAGGNDGPQDATSLSPANNPSAFSVGAVDASAVIASFSARGPSACTGGTYPNLVAPGAGVRTADLSFGGSANYAAQSGTSYAAPHVAGAIALLMQAAPSASVAGIESALVQSALPLGPAGPDNAFGHGLLDIDAAFLLLGGLGSPFFIASTPVTAATQGAAYLYQVTASPATGVTFSLDVAPSGMSVGAQSGLITWTPTNAQVGPNAVTVRAASSSGQSDTQSFTVTVANVNDAPVARDDAATAPRRTKGAYASVAIDVAANDTDPDGDLAAATVAIAAAPDKGGAVAVNANGTVSYTPKANFKGRETFKYTVGDTHGARSNVATVTVEVK